MDKIIMLSGIQLWFYGTSHMFLSRQSTTTSFEGTPIDPIARADLSNSGPISGPGRYRNADNVTAIAYFNSQWEINTLISLPNSTGTTG